MLRDRGDMSIWGFPFLPTAVFHSSVLCFCQLGKIAWLQRRLSRHYYCHTCEQNSYMTGRGYGKYAVRSTDRSIPPPPPSPSPLPFFLLQPCCDIQCVVITGLSTSAFGCPHFVHYMYLSMSVLIINYISSVLHFISKCVDIFWLLSPRLNRLGREVDHPFPVFGICAAIPALAHMPLWR